MKQEQEAGRVGEYVHHHEIGVRLRGAELQCCGRDRVQRGLQRRVQLFVALLAEARRLHAAAQQIEAEIEIARVLGIELEEPKRRGAQPVARCLRLRDGSLDGIPKRRERSAQHLRIDRLLGVEVKIEGGGGVAGACRDRAQAGSFEPLRLEHLAGRRQDERPFMLAHRLSSADPLLFHPVASRSAEAFYHVSWKNIPLTGNSNSV